MADVSLYTELEDVKKLFCIEGVDLWTLETGQMESE